MELKIQSIVNKITLFADGELGTPIFSRHPVGNVPFSMSAKEEFINGKHTCAASLKSVSLLSSFFLVTYNHGVLLAHLSTRTHNSIDVGILKYISRTGRRLLTNSMRLQLKAPHTLRPPLQQQWQRSGTYIILQWINNKNRKQTINMPILKQEHTSHIHNWTLCWYRWSPVVINQKKSFIMMKCL